MMKKTKKNSVLFGDQLPKSSSLKEDLHLITYSMFPRFLGLTGIL